MTIDLSRHWSHEQTLTQLSKALGVIQQQARDLGRSVGPVMNVAQAIEFEVKLAGLLGSIETLRLNILPEQ